MTLQQIESQCRSKAEELIKKYFGNINHEAAIEQPETIGDYSLDLPRQIEAEYYDYLKGLGAEIAPDDPRTFEQIIDKKHLSEQAADCGKRTGNRRCGTRRPADPAHTPDSRQDRYL